MYTVLIAAEAAVCLACEVRLHGRTQVGKPTASSGTQQKTYDAWKGGDRDSSLIAHRQRSCIVEEARQAPTTVVRPRTCKADLPTKSFLVGNKNHSMATSVTTRCRHPHVRECLMAFGASPRNNTSARLFRKRMLTIVRITSGGIITIRLIHGCNGLNPSLDLEAGPPVREKISLACYASREARMRFASVCGEALLAPLLETPERH